MHFHDRKKGKGTDVCAGRKSPCMVMGAGGSTFVLELWRCSRQEASSLLAVSPWELLIEESSTLPCSALTASQGGAVSSCGNGTWSRGQQPDEVSKMEPGFAQWSMVGRQKTPDINCKERGSCWTEGKMCSWWEESGNGAAAQGRLCTLSSEAFKVRPDKTHSNLVSPCSELKSTRGPFHPELPSDLE